MKKTLLLFLLFGMALSAHAGTVYTKPAVRDAWADSAAAGDITDPGNSFAAAGWLSSTTPPARQYWNWVLNYDGNGVRYLMQNGISTWDAIETYPINAIVKDSSGYLYESATTTTGNTPSSSPSDWNSLFTITPAAGDNTGRIATTQFVTGAVAPLAPLASPSFTGTPAAPTASPGNNNAQIATTAFVQNALASYAPLASPALTGAPAAPTATLGTNTTQLATTAFVQNAVTGGSLGFVPVQQGGGTGQGTNKIYIGWLGSNLGLQVASTNYGQNWPINITGSAASASNVPWSGVSGKPTTIAGYGITDFTSSAASPGYLKQPGGVIFEWGAQSCIASSPGTAVYFPLAFPHAVFSIQLTANGGNATVTVLSENATYFNCINGTGGTNNWFAVGY